MWSLSRMEDYHLLEVKLECYLLSVVSTRPLSNEISSNSSPDLFEFFRYMLLYSL